jgi:hypothetical protein
VTAIDLGHVVEVRGATVLRLASRKPQRLLRFALADSGYYSFFDHIAAHEIGGMARDHRAAVIALAEVLIEHRTLILTACRAAVQGLVARAFTWGRRDLGDAPPGLARPWRSRWLRSGVGAITDMA